jgi:hypothetical protein
VLAVSATYTPALLAQLEQLMREPQRVLLSPETTSLLGVRQFYSLVPGARPLRSFYSESTTTVVTRRMLLSLPIGPVPTAHLCSDSQGCHANACLW